MDAKEFRIGNWVEDRGGKRWKIDCWESPIKVACKAPLLNVDPVFGEMLGHPFTEEIDFLKPIPLTEDILLKCGFENRGMIIELEGCYGSISYYKDEFYIYSGLGDSESYSFTTNKIKHLHQLQNIYFALTEEELYIEL